MLDQLIAYIASYSGQSLLPSEIDLVNSMFRVKKLRKKQYLLQAGDVGVHYAFIVKGAMRQYAVCDNGTDSIIQLGIENWWIGDRESFVSSKPSLYNIDAWEDCELNVITRAQTLELIDQSPAFCKMVRIMDERNAIAAQKRITALINFTAEQRYSFFLENHPFFLQRFPLHMVASYLGVTKETLSRVRTSAAGKES